MLPEYLARLARESYQRRNAAIAKLTTPAAIERRKQWVRETFWKLTGGEPQRTPLNPRTTGRFERSGYRVENVVYESRPGLPVTANLYVPTTGQPPYPGVLFQMGHTLNGKAGDSYQKCCQGLARLGYVVLAFDPMGQGERTYYPKPGGTTTRLQSADDEHTKPGRQMLLTGDTATRLQVWDAVRSLDYLAALPMVDPKRLASTGQSGGGTLTMLLAAVDDRLAAAAVSSGNTENLACADFNPPGSTDDAEQDLIGAGPLGFDRWDLLYPIAPKPLLILVSARDFFGTYSPSYLTSGREEYKKLERVYNVLGAHEHLAWSETPLPHGLTYAQRVHIYNWFERWLRGSTRSIDREPEVHPEDDKTLWVGRTGNVVRDFESKTPFSLNRERAATLRPEKPSRADLVQWLRVEDIRPAPFHVIARVPSEQCRVEAVDTRSSGNVSAPAWLLTPNSETAGKPVLVIFEPNGRNAHWQEGNLYHQLAAAGRTVCAADVRGVGELTPEFGRGQAGYARSHQQEEDYAWASLMLGRPLLGQRVTDMLAIVRAFPAGRKIAVAALGKMTVPALFAAAIEPRIESLYLAGGLVSYRSIVEREDYTHPLANLLPGILEHTDLPQIAALLAPRRLIIAGAVDGAGQAANIEEVRQAYTSAEIRPEAAWDAGTLLKL
jgi:cephalosporin-C deacetylase-like acetyl esterase